MSSEDECRARARQRGRDYINSEAGAVAAEALGDLLEALEKVREANGDDERKRAHEQVLTSRAAFEAATGVLGFRRRRIVSTAAGLPAHRNVATAKGIDAIFTRRGHTTEQRFAAGRILIDEVGALLGGRPENLEAATLILGEMGYHGPQGKLGKDSGIRGPTIRQGVNAGGGGPSAAGRLNFYTVLGYTLGAEGKRDCPPQNGNSARRCISDLSAHGPSQGLNRRSNRLSRLAWRRLSASWPLRGLSLRMSRRTVIRTLMASFPPAYCFGPPGGKATPLVVRGIPLISHGSFEQNSWALLFVSPDETMRHSLLS